MDEVLIVDAIPPELELLAISDGPEPPEFETWYCVLPDAPGNFDSAEFAAYRGAGCALAPPEDITAVTHLAFYAEKWGNGKIINNFRARLLTMPRVGLPEGTEAHNVAEISSTTWSYDREVDDWTTIRTIADGDISNFIMGGGHDPVTAGESWVYIVSAKSGNMGGDVRNPTVEVVLPPGVIYEGSSVRPFESTCDWQPPPEVWDEEPTLTTGPDGETILTWTFGDEEHPVWLPGGCGNNVQDMPIVIDVEASVDPEYPWVNGDSFTAVATLTGENLIAPVVAEKERTVAAPAEMWTKVEPACTAEEAGLLRVWYANTGGATLTNVVVEISIPKAGDGSPTAVDTFFAGIGAEPGAQVEYLVGGSWTPKPPEDLAMVEAVRITISKLDPYTGKLHFDVLLDFPPGTEAGTRVYGHSTIDAAVLLPVDSVLSAALTTEECPATVDVVAFYDADGDGVWDEDEEALEDWIITATNEETGETVTFTVEDDGTGSQSLPAGDWSFTAQPPQGHGGDGGGEDGESGFEWGQVLVNLVSGGSGEVVFGLSCECEDGDHCTADGCDVATGACVFAPLSFPEAVELCDGIDDDCDGAVDNQPGLPDGSACPPTGTHITSGPDEESWDDAATFTFEHESGAAGTKYECRLDGGAWVPCDGIFSADGLSEGEHTFEVRARDPYGNVDEEGDSWTWTVLPNPCDFGAPIEGWGCPARLGVVVFYDADGDGEQGPGEVVLAGWQVIARDAESGAELLFVTDDSGYVDALLPPGDWTLTASAPDWLGGSTGWADAEAARGLEAGEQAELALPVGCGCADADPCTRDLCAVPSGECLFVPAPIEGAVESCDGGDSDCDGTVDNKPGLPEGSACPPTGTTITEAPEEETDETSGRFAFTHEEGAEGTSYECRVDGGPWVPCDGTFETGELDEGEHRFEVRAVDPWGNVDPEPASYDWVIVPDACIDDVDAPEIACAASLEVDVPASSERCGASPEVAPTALWDACGGEPGVQVATTGAADFYPVGATELCWEARDASGNQSSCCTALEVVDRMAPAVSCGLPAGALAQGGDVVIEAVDACGASVTLEELRCEVVLGDGTVADLPAARCPVRANGSGLSVDPEAVCVGVTGRLRVAYRVVATDPSGNRTALDCLEDVGPPPGVECPDVPFGPDTLVPLRAEGELDGGCGSCASASDRPGRLPAGALAWALCCALVLVVRRWRR